MLIHRTQCTAGTRIKCHAALTLSLFLGQYFGEAAAQTVNWINDSSGSWTTGTNWSTGLPPAPGASVVIDRGAANPTVTLQDTAQVNRIQSAEAFSIGAPASPIGGALFLSSPSLFSGPLLHLAGTLSSSSTIDVSGRLTVFNSVMSGGGTTNASGGIDITGPVLWLLGHHVVNSGPVRVMNNDANLLISRGSSFTNLAGATFDIQTRFAVRSTDHLSGAPGVFVNHGLIQVTGGTGASLGSINNFGMVNSLAPSLGFFGTNSGVINAAGGSQLFLSGTFESSSVVNAGNADVVASGSIRGTFSARTLTIGGATEWFAPNPLIGDLKISNGTLTLLTGTAITVPTLTLLGNALHNNTNFSGGVLGGSDVLTVTGMLDWLGGTLVGPGTTNALGGIVLRSGLPEDTGGKQLRGGHTLNNYGTATWISGDLVMNEGAIFNNKSGALVDFTNNFGISHFSFLAPTPVFNNDGVLRKSGGDAPGGVIPTPSSTITVIFNNRGSVDVDSGLLRLTGGGTSTGSFNVAPGKAIEFGGGHLLLPSSSVNAAAATVIFSTRQGEDQMVAGGFEAARTRIIGGAAFTGNSPQLGTVEIESGALKLIQASGTAAGVSNFFGLVSIDRASGLSLAPGTQFVQQFGTTIVNGTLDAKTVDIRSGILAGSGQIRGAVFNGGELRPGEATDSGTAGGKPGQLTILGDFTQRASGLLSMGIAGNTAVSEYDVLSIDGVAFLAGTLRVSLLDGFMPDPGDSFVIMTFLSHVGTFDFMNGLFINPFLEFVPVYNSNNLILQVVGFAQAPEAPTWALMAIGLLVILLGVRGPATVCNRR